MRCGKEGQGDLGMWHGACAVLVASVLNGISERKATVKLLGGILLWSGMKIITRI